MKKLSSSIEKFCDAFMNLECVSKKFSLTEIRDLVAADRRLRNERFDNLIKLSKQCYDFRIFWNSQAIKEERSRKKIDITLEAITQFLFGWNKTYFYEVAAMGENCVKKPAKLQQYIKMNEVSGGDVRMDAKSFNSWIKDGKLVTKSNTKQTASKQEPEEPETVNNVTEPTDEIVFHLLIDKKEFIVMSSSEGGFITKVIGIASKDVKAFITKYATKSMQDLLRNYGKHLPYGSTYVNNVLDLPSGLSKKKEETIRTSLSCYKW